MWRLLALLLTKYCHKLSLEGPAPFWRASSRIWLRTDSLSSSGNKAGTMPTKGTRLEKHMKKCHLEEDTFCWNIPEVSMLLMSSKNPSSATCASVKRNTVFLFSIPSFKYNAFKSSRKFDSLYPLLSVISNTYKKQNTSLKKYKTVLCWISTSHNKNRNNNKKKNNLTACSEGSELGEGLFARTFHTNEQSVGAVDAEDSVHSCQMFQSIVE